jgi:uncharacterized membrane protein
VAVSVVGTGGRVHYALTDRAAVRGIIEMRILTAEQLTAVEAEEPEGEPVQELRLRAPERTGAVMLNALSPWQGGTDKAEELLLLARCEQQAVSAE